MFLRSYLNFFLYYNRFQDIPQPDFSDPFSFYVVGVKRYFAPYDAYELLRCKAAPAILFYSFRSAVTGSLFAALRDGIRPPMKVRNTLRPISTIAGSAGRDALT